MTDLGYAVIVQTVKTERTLVLRSSPFKSLVPIAGDPFIGGCFLDPVRKITRLALQSGLNIHNPELFLSEENP